MLYVHGIGHFHPENIIDNAFLESLEINTTEQWIMKYVGVRTRRTVLPLDYIYRQRNGDRRAAEEAAIYSNEATGEKAARMALDRAGLDPSDIGLVVSGSSAPAHTSPAEACLIASKLNIGVPGFDLGSACTTFVAQLRLLALIQPDALPDFVLVVAPENLTRVVDYTDRSTAVLMGDCTIAAVVSARVPARLRIVQIEFESNPAASRTVTIPATGYLRQDGAAVQVFAIKKTAEMFRRLKGKAAGTPYLVGHQANLVMLRAVCARAEVTSDRHLYNVDDYGNCGAAGSASVISQFWNNLKDGDEICLAVVGAGLSWGGALLKYTASPS
jgi:3-oxoacyl-[acyl-carrier-protein] synthase-3